MSTKTKLLIAWTIVGIPFVPIIIILGLNVYFHFIPVLIISLFISGLFWAIDTLFNYYYGYFKGDL